MQVLLCKTCLAGSTFHSKLTGGCLPAADLPISVCPAAVQTAVRQLQKKWLHQHFSTQVHLQADVRVICLLVRQRTLVIVFMPTVAAVKPEQIQLANCRLRCCATDIATQQQVLHDLRPRPRDSGS